MKMKNFSRRKFIVNTSAGAAGALLTYKMPAYGMSKKVMISELALKGGKPVRNDGWLKWPVWEADAE
ncbi:MAG: hypothetical protein V3V53_07485, partial [Bacteroidales bacterium]